MIGRWGVVPQPGGRQWCLRSFGFDFQLIGGGKVTALVAAVTVIVLLILRHRRWALWFAIVSVGVC